MPEIISGVESVLQNVMPKIISGKTLVLQNVTPDYYTGAPQLTWLPLPPKKHRKTEDENREFKVEWTENFAFIQNLNGLPKCLICKEKFAHNKKSNLERHFTRKHASFTIKCPTGDARKKAPEELQKSQESSISVFNNWMQSSSNINMASFVFSQEIAKRGKVYTDGEYINNCFINASGELFQDFKNKADILKRIKELPLSAKTLKYRAIKMRLNITTQHIEDLKLVSALSLAVDESCDIDDTAQVSLFVRFMSHLGPKEELLRLLSIKGQTRGEDIANAVIECMDKHPIPLDKILSISTDGVKSHNVTINGDRYRALITNFFIPELKTHDVQELWFQQDGATCHTARSTIDLLKDTFGDRLISRFGPVNWPPRSCDLTPLDYFLWGYVKSLVYADKPQTLDHLEDNIRRGIADIRPQMLEKSHRKLMSRLTTSEPAVAVLCQKSYLKCNATRLSFE
ncbi:SCAN domain-containing protein 3 [Trichonephila clavipes]|nr:SCAN domain-containing protein 3 [Trichonephila clavipes]